MGSVLSDEAPVHRKPNKISDLTRILLKLSSAADIYISAHVHARAREREREKTERQRER